MFYDISLLRQHTKKYLFHRVDCNLTGTWKMKMDPNGWTAYTRDGGLSCQYEHTLAITKDGPRILTSQGEEGTY